MSEAPHNLKLEPTRPRDVIRPPGSRLRSWLVAAMLLVIAGLAVLDALVVSRRGRYREETARLRASMSVLERQHADEIVSQEHNKLRLALALLRR